MKTDEETPQLPKGLYIHKKHREKESQTLLPLTRMQRGAQESGIESNDKKIKTEGESDLKTKGVFPFLLSRQFAETETTWSEKDIWEKPKTLPPLKPNNPSYNQLFLVS